ncbi:non-specific lipid-transfer protein 1 [Capsicum annuum]|uniref:non-specific lipid-transfer protein 1 n=1 Tax=Capsicum annuum TaxID=4072 RepID=UPI001FB12A61|nr:non-specific lipid-transfer protein 1 [Capsicum annuum]
MHSFAEAYSIHTRNRFSPTMASDLNMLSKKLITSLLFIFLVLSPPSARAVITCNMIYKDLKPCLRYVLIGGSVPTKCCTGVKSLVANATTTADRQAACSCVKNLATSATDKQFDRAARIPAQCGANVPFEISRDADCSK